MVLRNNRFYTMGIFSRDCTEQQRYSSQKSLPWSRHHADSIRFVIFEVIHCDTDREISRCQVTTFDELLSLLAQSSLSVCHRKVHRWGKEFIENCFANGGLVLQDPRETSRSYCNGFFPYYRVACACTWYCIVEAPLLQ
jgi:hypothetical protein